MQSLHRHNAICMLPHLAFLAQFSDVAPFVGHNALLRWSAVKDVSFVEEGIRKFWAEDTVSEDFELSLR